MAYVRDRAQPEPEQPLRTTFQNHLSTHEVNMSAQRRSRPRSASVGRFRWPGLLVGAASVVLGAAALLSASAATAAAPSSFVGHLDSVTVATSSVIVRGWAVDTDQPNSSARITTYIGGTAGSAGVIGTGQVLAHDERADVGRALPGYGNHRGFGNGFIVNPGRYPVCVYVSGYSGGAQALLGCVTVSVPADRKPIGHLDAARSAGNGNLVISGWAADPNTPTASLRVSIYLGGVYGKAFKSISATANQSRPDVAAALPGYGAAHGFSVTVPAKSGSYPVCSYAINDYSYGAAMLFPCVTATS